MSNTQIGLFVFGGMLFLAGIMFLLVSILLAYFGKNGSGYAVSSASIAFIFAVILFAFSQGNVTEVLMQWGNLSAQITRSEEVIKEANATIAQLRQTALIFAEPTFLNLALSGNFMVGLTADKKIEFREKVAASLRQIGIDESEINKAAIDLDEMFYKYHRERFLKSLIDETKKSLPQGDLTPKKIRALGLSLSSESNELLKDWEYFEENKKLRRPELWQYHAAG